MTKESIKKFKKEIVKTWKKIKIEIQHTETYVIQQKQAHL